MKRIINVSNRLPVTIQKTITKSSGGLVSALEGVQDRFDLSWIGWPGGTHDDDTEQDRIRRQLMLEWNYVPVFLDEREMDIFQDEENGTRLWQAYRKVAQSWKNFQMKRIGRPADIYPVFRELFAKQPKDAAALRKAV